MKKYVLIYHSPAEAMAKMADVSPEDKANGMKPWFAWKEKCGNALIDFGAPLLGGKSVDNSGRWNDSTKEVSGYSILQGENVKDIEKLIDGHPHLAWVPGCSIEIHECMSM